MILEPDGRVERETVYAPFGAIHDDEGAHGTDTEVFAGHPREPATGLHYMQARWQHPGTGSFLSVDPLVASVADPQSFNAYSYARANPVRYVDPTGMQFEWLDPMYLCYCWGVGCPASEIPIPPAGGDGFPDEDPWWERGQGPYAKAESVETSESGDGVRAVAKEEGPRSNVERALHDIIRDIENGTFREIGVSDPTVELLRQIVPELIDSIPGAAADITMKRTPAEVPPSKYRVFEAKIRITMEQARTLGGAYEALGHEIRHLSQANQRLSDEDPDGLLGRATSPRESDALRWGRRIRKHYGE